MWLKLEFPLAGEALKQENTGRNDLRCSPFTQVKGFIRPAPLVLGSSDPIKTTNLSLRLLEWTQTHKWSQWEQTETEDSTQQLQGEITAGVCARPFDKVCPSL